MSTPALGAAAAGTWQLGDLTVNRLGFGAMRLTGSLPFGRGTAGDRAQSLAVLRRAVELGVNHIDTASFYFSALRSANELINSALAPYPDDLVIVTKVWPGRDPWGEWYSARPDQLRGQVEENLRQLGRDHLDVVNLRRSGRESVAEHFAALAELREAGLIRHLGVSDVSVAQLEEALAIAPVVCVQNRYGISDRTHDPVLRACAERGIAFVPFFAVAGGPPPVGRRGERAGRPARGRAPSRCDRGPGPPGLDAPPGPAGAGHPRYRQPRPPGGECRRRGGVPQRGRPGPPRPRRVSLKCRGE